MVIFLDPNASSVTLTYLSERLQIAPVVTFASTWKAIVPVLRKLNQIF